ncbi:unnamed protein product [Notodromas monacha]|uniref:DOMON domain-containing protein n=1 Tax=Notodromas monacha TaxID=399045 RepID=A0A7R9GHA2_9CRUS|nr:unnamed protein product [Notodromas monacha]CAG0921256.1 unnamed protein product [Notodromas monacha]
MVVVLATSSSDGSKTMMAKPLFSFIIEPENMFKFVATFVALVACVSAAPSRQLLQLDDVLSIEYSMDENAVLTATLSGSTGGWVGAGANSNCTMAGADLVIGWVNDDGEAIVQDYHGQDEENGLPILDDSQDAVLIDGSGDESSTVITFSKAPNPEDSGDFLAELGSPVFLLFAHNTVDPVLGNELSGDDYHGASRGCVDLSNGKIIKF